MMMQTTELSRKAHRHKSRVKTGCKTCKIRRVKCDEEKPSCTRCNSTGRKCDGYATQNESQIAGHGQALIFINVASPVFKSGFGDNVQHLEFYHHCARPTLSSAFDKEFWSRIVLQMAQSEPAVRHALIAVSYLHQTETGSLKYARSEFLANHNRQTLLFHYNKSVQCLIARMAESSYTAEIGLVTCVLFICIEYLRANYNTAFVHLTNGLKILSEREKCDPKYSGTMRNGTIGVNDMIEEKIRPIFIRGMMSGLLYGVIVEKVFDISCPLPEELREGPFESLLEAQSISHEIRNASVLYIRVISKKLLHRETITTKDLQLQQRLLMCHDTWYQNLEHFASSNRLAEEDITTISALKVAYQATYLYTACTAAVLQMQYDVYLERFKSLIRHAKIVLASMNLTASSTAHFTFEMSLIAPIYFVATRCRCPTTRREAASLLSLNLPREGLWDAQQQAVVSQRIIEMEESEVDVDTGWPVERTRIWSTVIDGNMDRNGGFWVYFLPARLVGEVDDNGRPKVLNEWFVL
ncbi:hypothetical protein B0J11DRAFT_555236 [Dendryphion nanum]|uniref:Zn(2)-C6 fungal-type domain-containing protein n=1 Tax=Dendryphion nanum TaxID=256645 RepID=A0A9P9EJ83_9PLEO|nr:hypothetical protein B0J11DRAFT_555236 [Dendryphion nanum]